MRLMLRGSKEDSGPYPWVFLLQIGSWGIVGLWWLNQGQSPDPPLLVPVRPLSTHQRKTLILGFVGRKGPNYYPNSSNSNGTGEAGSQERPLKMFEHKNPCFHLSCPIPTNSLEGSSAGPPLLYKAWIALKNQATTLFSPGEGKSFTGPKSALSGVT